MGSCEDVEYGEVFSVPNPAAGPARLLDFSLHQPQLRFPPSYGFHSLPAAGYLPSPPQTLPLGGTPSPVSSTITTELESPEDLSADDAVLAYINQFLLEDEDEDEPCGPGASAAAAPGRDSALLAVEKPFVDIIAHAKPAAAAPYQLNNFWVDPCCGFQASGGGLSDVIASTRHSSCQLVPCEEPVKEEEQQCAVHRGRKKSRQDDELEEERRRKQSAVSEEETIREMFDNVLLCNCANCELQSPLPDESELRKVYVKGSGNRRGRKKGKPGAVIEEETVDLTTLLIHCAQATAIDDHRGAGELLKQIRRHSSAHGDAGQRLAHYIANGLEARLAGAGSIVQFSLVAHRTSTSDMLKIVRLYSNACPFLRLSRFFSNQSILNASKGATSLHIIDYGTDYGFQWPVFLQRVAKLAPPPRIRFTAIDLPQPGFRPLERLEATGRRLHEYARMFKIPFEYHPIAAKWDAVRIEDLRIDKDDFLIVNCLFRMRHMMDETVADESPRMTVLNTIRKMNPHLFVHSIVNGTYNAPFFVTRFKEALFYYSSLFDMLETTVSRLDEHRLLIERDFFAREALNVIACEGMERVERPETYKQWQVRNLRAGFRQQPLNQETVKKARYKVTKGYHRDFFVDEDNKWMLQGWKGRVIVASSTWKPS